MQPKRILVALAGTPVDADVVRLAVTLAKANRAEIVAIHVIEVRWNLPLDAVLDRELELGEKILADATSIAEKAGVTMETEMLQAREAAAAIVDDARDRKSDLIVIGMPYRTRMGKTYIGKTAQALFVKAGCAVLGYRQETLA